MEVVWKETGGRVRTLASKPDRFYDEDKSKETFGKAKAFTKVFYDAAKVLEAEEDVSTLPQLIIDEFDSEQVWAGVELQNKAKFNSFSDQVHDLLQAFSLPSQPDLSLLAKPKVKSQKTQEPLEESDQDDLGDLAVDQDQLFEDQEEEQQSEQEEEDEVKSEDDGEDDPEEDDADIFNDPDFAHMSDSDLDDKLPLFEGEDSEDDSPDEDKDDTEEAKKQKNEEKAEQEMKAKTEDYMANALQSLRSNAGGETKSKNPRAQVEDDFFKLDDMEKFLEAQDAADNRRRLREEKDIPDIDSDSDGDEDNENAIDMFSADLGGALVGDEDESSRDSDHDAETESGKAKKSVRGMRYNDYFNTNTSTTTKQKKKDKSKKTLVESAGSDGEAGSESEKERESEEDDQEDQEDQSDVDDPEHEDEPTSAKMPSLLDDASEDDEDLGEVKSSHEEKMSRLQRKIQHMEAEALKGNSAEGKAWQLKGEVAGPDRPENSLLQEHLDYDTVSKQAPVITEAVSKTLEEIIIRRIKDRAWDDVERKVKPVENPYEYKKRLVLDQEKSKLSLAQVYEQEYLKQQEALEESKKTPGMLDADGDDKIPPEVEDIRTAMKQLFAKLDTLTHFHYTPKMAGQAEVKIVRNAPTLAMEEVAPVAMSDANLLAPQEIVDKRRGQEIGSTEKEDTDKKRERRKKKSAQRAKAAEKDKREKLVNRLNPGLGNKYSKAKMMKDLESAEKQGKLTKIKEDTVKGKAVKSSTAFFNQLQSDSQTTGSGKQHPKSSKNKKQVIAANLKL